MAKHGRYRGTGKRATEGAGHEEGEWVGVSAEEKGRHLIKRKTRSRRKIVRKKKQNITGTVHPKVTVGTKESGAYLHS